MVETYETLLYHQKQALQSWQNAASAASAPTGSEIRKLVWELLVLCADNLTNPSIDNDDEISDIAGDLASLVLKSADVRTLNSIYRDALIEAVLQHIPENQQFMQRMIHFSNLVSDAFREVYTDKLRRLISKQKTSRISEELILAKRIQERLLPKAIPQVPGFQIAGRVIPALEVGGDYWSVKYYEEDGVVTMKLADITGHGIAAATLVAAVKFISGGYYRGAKSAHEVMERTNRTLVLETPVEILVTMVYCWLYPDTKEIDIVNAGHEPVFICNDGLCIDILPTGPVLGVEQADYGEKRLKLEAGDILFFCSDGITEAGIGEPFGTARVKDLVIQNKDRTAEEIADAVIKAVTDYVGQSHDDMSLVVLKAVSDESS
ncbi:MAG: PP2C family protein-serine/threonine phosphatase [Armatimonadota bacterium]